jgi:TRAP-type transport system periplasmic protein
MKRIIAILLVLLVAPVIFISCKKKPGEVITLNYSIFFPPTHGQCKAGEMWAKEIEDKTDGKVKINIYPGGTLVKAEDTFTGVVKGVTDIGMSCFAYTRGRFPIMEAVDLPLGYPDGKTATKVANEYFKAMKPKELDDVKLLLIHAHGPGLLHSVKPIKTLADLKGMKIRSTGLSSKIVTALGGIPVAMPQPETYEAVQKGVVDGTFGPIETLKGWKHAEVIKNTTDCRDVGYTTAMFVVMNKAKWESLPDDVKKAFEEVSEKWIDVHGKKWDELDDEGRGYTKDKGNAIIELAAEENAKWVAAVHGIINDYIRDVKAKGLPGDKAVAELKKLIGKK